MNVKNKAIASTTPMERINVGCSCQWIKGTLMKDSSKRDYPYYMSHNLHIWYRSKSLWLRIAFYTNFICQTVQELPLFDVAFYHYGATYLPVINRIVIAILNSITMLFRYFFIFNSMLYFH